MSRNFPIFSRIFETTTANYKQNDAANSLRLPVGNDDFKPRSSA